MPTYDFFCETCDKLEERWFSIHEAIKAYCVECGKELIKVITPPMYNKHQNQTQVVKTDQKGSYVKHHWDGKQDVYIVPEVVKKIR